MPKLNYKRTFLIGFAFMSICAFWQMYDSIIPLILKNTFHLGDTVSGAIMAADNVIALFLLPLLGALSDKVDTRIGKRMPFIVGGTVFAAILINLLPLFDNKYYTSSLQLYFWLFITVLGFLLITLATYRSPAVALMPDLTPKPLRSKGNAVINLMGAVGGVVYLVLAKILYSDSVTHSDYTPIFAIISAFMLGSVMVLFFTVNEKKALKEVEAYEKQHPEDDLAVENERGDAVLPKPVKISLGFLLASIFLWFTGYNAISSAFTKFADVMWGLPLGDASMCVTIASVGAIISYFPIGILSSKIGRKKTIVGGTALLTLCFAAIGILAVAKTSVVLALDVCFALVGVAWAAINVNSLPMVVEMCKGSDVGKFTGIYYTFSMAAQIVTPIISGALLEYVGYWTLFPYAALFVLLSTVTMLFVKHGDSKPAQKKDLIESFDVDD